MQVNAIIKRYPPDFHVTTVHMHRVAFALSGFPLNWAAASKKKEFVWTDDEAELLLAVTHDCEIKRLVEGTRDYQQK